MEEKSLEELLQVIEQAEEKKERSVKNRHINSVDRFISDLGITSGLDKVPTHIIYYHYRRKWYDNNKDKKVTKIVFFRSFNKKFVQSRTGKQRYYLLNKEAFDLSREEVLKAEHFDRRLKSGKKEKKEKR
jgi:hypothetical protein